MKDELKEFLEKIKTGAELPNNNPLQFNIGYVKAVNDILNYHLKKNKQ